jgi:hypothetical protein
MKNQKRLRGTVWYFGDIAVAITSLIGTLFMLFMAAMIMFVLNVQLDANVIGVLMYSTPKADNMLFTYLDSTADGHQMKELLAYSELTGNSTFTLDGKAVDIRNASAAIMGKITAKPYTLSLMVGSNSVRLASAGKVEAVENIKTETMVQGGGLSGKLTLVTVK